MKYLLLLTLLLLAIVTSGVNAQDGATQCDGFMPSRLQVGQLGRVTPGDANNVRIDPQADAELINKIPGGGVFEVLAGPVCGDQGAWWQVSHQEVLGWTLEGKGNTYWTEPFEPLTTPPNLPYQIVSQGEVLRGLSQVYIWDILTGNYYPVTFDYRGARAPLWSHDGLRIAYDIPYVNASGIHIINADGSTRQALVNSSSPYRMAWSPDDSRIAYSHFATDYPELDNPFINLYSVAIDGSDKRQITNNNALVTPHETGGFVFINTSGATTVEWSPDATRFFFTVDKYPENTEGIYYAPADANMATDFTPFIVPSFPIRVEDFAWSPDGQKLLVEEYVSSGEIQLVMYDQNGQYLYSVFAPSQGGIYDFDWSPDGSGFLVLTYDNASGSSLYFITTNGETVYQIIEPIRVLSVDWRPVPERAPAPVIEFWSANETCPGFMPSRLSVNQRGRVIPGDANNVRAEPTIDSELVAQIEGGNSFWVRWGPVCNSDGLWWFITWDGDFNETDMGWTLEGRGDSYWLEPLN